MYVGPHLNKWIVLVDQEYVLNKDFSTGMVLGRDWTGAGLINFKRKPANRKPLKNTVKNVESNTFKGTYKPLKKHRGKCCI